MKRVKIIFSIFAVVSAAFTMQGQDVTDTLHVNRRSVDMRRLKVVTDSLIRSYKFAEATVAFESAKADADSLTSILIDEAMVQAQNGNSMKGFCSNPVAVARKRFSLKDFFLYFPLPDKSWRAIPNQLDSSAHDRFVRATYVPEGSEQIYWSAKDQEGIRNIYRTEHQDSLWSVPELINEQVTSSSDEIYPMLSPDGKQLFFASRGLYGMGGYDLYVSDWDENLKDWGIPVNMGFPYSSPYDDFLFINTADGKYSMFASNRACQADSVDIYVLEFDSMPVRKAIDSPEELEKLCRLEPADDPERVGSSPAAADDMQDNADMRRYSDKLLQVRSLRDSIYKHSTDLDKDRSWLTEVSGQERSKLAASILSKEALIPKLKDSLAVASRELQKIELEFLQSGVVIDPEKLQHEADREIVGGSAGYTFAKMNMGAPLHLEMQKPKPSFDYTFQVLEEGRFAEDNTLPGGLIYQIQIFLMSNKATVKQIKGLSPVFERIGSTGKRIYSVGLFHSYKDVLANLNKVKRVGFRSAIIVAFLDGKPITVQKARALEKTIHELFQVRIFPADGAALNDTEMATVKVVTEADMARTTEGGVISFILGPYDSRAEADAVISALKISGITNVRIESAGMSEIK